MEIVSGGVSDVGRVRTNNEDSYPNSRFAAPVCSFRWHGRRSSWRGCQCLGCGNNRELLQPKPKTILALLFSERSRTIGRKKRGGCKAPCAQANLNIFESAQKNPAQRGMGATVTAAWANERQAQHRACGR